MSQIDDKYQQLKNAGLDLGAPLEAETNAHSGGRVRRYVHGHIYFHPNTGAHEVHGGILSLYLANGGPGPSPLTGARELGYPTTDEIPGAPPHSQFEWGAIYWTRGTGGCVLPGPIWGRYRQGPDIGLPITSAISVADGRAAFFERGIIYAAQAGGRTRVITGFVTPPLLGQPAIVDLGATSTQAISLNVRWAHIMREDHDALVALRPGVFTDILAGRYSITPVGATTRVEFVAGQGRMSGTHQVDVNVQLTLPSAALTDRTLYDLRCALPHGTHYALSPHCYYTKTSWDNFGLLHATDLHISRRNDEFRQRLHERGLTDAAANYSNFQDNFRDLVRYANKLHTLGLADAVLATGDLVDYAREDGDAGLTDNFERLRRLILGEGLSASSTAGEELRIPIFATFGNHDYRVHPYHLRANIEPISPSLGQALNEYSSHNLLESDALALQDERTPSFGLGDSEEALRMLWTDQSQNAYRYFEKYFSRQRNYVVTLGRNRLVLLDTQRDEGLPGDASLDTLLGAAARNEATARLLSGNGPNSWGFGTPQIQLLREAIHEAGVDGTVIVGIHAPAISPKHSEYPFYMRETLHPTAPPALTDGYIAKNGLNGATWPRTGTRHFKTGTTADGLDIGIGWNGNQEFLEAAAGVGLARPADLILCGHVHRYVEHRFRHTGSGFEFYTDFYTENPKQYYPTNTLPGLTDLPSDAKIAVEVTDDAPLQPVVGTVRDHTGGRGTDSIPPTEYGRVRVPPYPAPLNNATNPKAWWQAHRPLHAQTSALGPIESRQRYGTFYRITNPPEPYRPIVESDRGFTRHYDSLTPLARPFVAPTFQGFRFVQVRSNVIAKMRYIRLAELRRNNFTMPWEPRRSEVNEDLPINHGGVLIE